MKHILLIATSLLMFNLAVSAQSMIAAKDAVKHVGEKVTICDKVVSEELKAFTIVLFVGGDRPNQLLTIIYRTAGKNKSNAHFDIPYQGKEICVTGIVSKDKNGKAVIRITDLRQIKPFMMDNPVKEKSSLN